MLVSDARPMVRVLRRSAAACVAVGTTRLQCGPSRRRPIRTRRAMGAADAARSRRPTTGTRCRAVARGGGASVNPWLARQLVTAPPPTGELRLPDSSLRRAVVEPDRLSLHWSCAAQLRYACGEQFTRHVREAASTRACRGCDLRDCRRERRIWSSTAVRSGTWRLLARLAGRPPAARRESRAVCARVGSPRLPSRPPVALHAWLGSPAIVRRASGERRHGPGAHALSRSTSC